MTRKEAVKVLGLLLLKQCINDPESSEREALRVAINSLGAFDNLFVELTTPVQDGYNLHKYTDEYGAVICVSDVVHILDKYMTEIE